MFLEIMNHIKILVTKSCKVYSLENFSVKTLVPQSQSRENQEYNNSTKDKQLGHSRQSKYSC